MSGGYGSTSSGGYGSFSGASPASGGGGGAFGFVKNLANDVKGAVEGFPAGVIHLAEHPLGSVEQMGKATWSTWSPLFHGQFTKFGQGVYEHPLAPILDIASVLSMGVGTAARIGAGMDALGATSAAADAGAIAGASRGLEVTRALLRPGHYFAPEGQLAKDAQILSHNATIDKVATEGLKQLEPASNIFHSAARLKLPAGKILNDPMMQGRMPIVKMASENAGRHLMQNVLGKGFDSLPPAMKGYLGRKIYERALWGKMAQRAVMAGAAKTGLITAVDRVSKMSPERLAQMEADAGKIAGHFPTLTHSVMASRLLHDENVGFFHRLQLVTHQWGNVDQHAPIVFHSVKDAANFLFNHKHMGTVKRFPDPGASLLPKIHGRIDYWTRTATKAAAVRTVESVQKELDHHNAALKDMADNGHYLPPALNSKGEPLAAGKIPTEKQRMNQFSALQQEHVRSIKELERQLKKSRSAEEKLAKAHSRLDELHQQRIGLEQRSFQHGLERHAATPESTVRFASNMGRYVTRSFKGDKWTEERIANWIQHNGWIGTDGHIPIVPMHDMQMMGKEFAGGLQYLSSIRKATSFWKYIQLKLTPKVLVNNTLANHTIAMFRHTDPITAFRALYHAHRVAYGRDFADQLIHDAVMTGGDKGWYMHNFGAELHQNTLLQGTEADLSKETQRMTASAVRKSGSRLGRKIRESQMMYGPVGKIADRPVRTGAVVTYIRNEPAVIHLADKLQRVAKLEGRQLSRNDALDQAAGSVLKSDPTLRDRASNFGRTIAGDYLATTPKERFVKDFVPFYLWDRHIAKSTANIALDTPIRAAFAQQLSNQGLSETKKFLGALPEFLQSAIPLQMLGLSGTSKDGRMNAVVGPSLNPFGTIGEFAGAAQSLLTGGDPSQAADLLGQINPILTDSLSAAAGKNLVTGTAEKGPGGLIPNLLYNLGSGFPQEKIVQSAIQGPITTTTTPSGKVFPKLFSENELAAVSNFLGIPIKQISPSTAQYEAKQQAPKKRKSVSYSGY